MVIFISVFLILFIDLCVVLRGDKFFFVIICLMFLIIMIVLLISRLMVRIIVNMVRVLIEKLNICKMVNVFSNIIGIVIVGISVVLKFCKNKYMIKNISIIVLIKVFIIFLIESDMNGVVL